MLLKLLNHKLQLQHTSKYQDLFLDKLIYTQIHHNNYGFNFNLVLKLLKQEDHFQSFE